MEHQESSQAAQELAASYAHFGMDWDEEEKRVTRDPATGRIIRSGDYGSDQWNTISFSTEKVLNKVKTAQEGRRMYTSMDFITIVAPGNAHTVIHRPVTEFDKFRFPFEYDAFKRGDKIAVHGTPLDEWDALSDEQLKDLKHHNIVTVEQIANLPDGAAGPLSHLTVLKARAKSFLEQHNKSVAVEALADRDREIADLKSKLDDVLRMLAEQGKPKAAKA